jgi:hypothetical protein
MPTPMSTQGAKRRSSFQLRTMATAPRPRYTGPVTSAATRQESGARSVATRASPHGSTSAGADTVRRKRRNAAGGTGRCARQTARKTAAASSAATGGTNSNSAALGGVEGRSSPRHDTPRGRAGASRAPGIALPSAARAASPAARNRLCRGSVASTAAAVARKEAPPATRNARARAHGAARRRRPQLASRAKTSTRPPATPPASASTATDRAITTAAEPLATPNRNAARAPSTTPTRAPAAAPRSGPAPRGNGGRARINFETITPDRGRDRRSRGGWRDGEGP